MRILVSAAALALLSACGDMDGTTDAIDPAPDAPAPAPDAPLESAPEVAPEEDPADVAAATVSTADTELGEVLTDGDGRTLYVFTVDEPGVSNCEGDCLEAWPPLLSDGAPQAEGAADPMLLGTLQRDDGSTQVSYDGWPLYYFAADDAPGDLKGQGVNDVWFVVAPDGMMIGADADEADEADDDTQMGSGPAGGYGY